MTLENFTLLPKKKVSRLFLSKVRVLSIEPLLTWSIAEEIWELTILKMEQLKHFIYDRQEVVFPRQCGLHHQCEELWSFIFYLIYLCFKLKFDFQVKNVILDY